MVLDAALWDMLWVCEVCLRWHSDRHCRDTLTRIKYEGKKDSENLIKGRDWKNMLEEIKRQIKITV
jgi:hypothetical protein